MLRIGKVLGTRSVLTVSKWYLYVYSMLKNWMLLLIFYCLLESLLKTWFGENGEGMKSLYSVIQCFGFVKVKWLMTKVFDLVLRTWDLNLVLLPQITIPTISFRFIWKISDLCRNWFDVEFVLLRRAYRIYYSLLGRHNISELNSSVRVYSSGFWKPGFIRMKRTFTSFVFAKGFIRVLKRVLKTIDYR